MTTNRHSGIRDRIAPVDPYRLGCFGGPVDFIFVTLLFLVRLAEMFFLRMEAVAFDCFGTVFDMTPVPREDIAKYVEHVRSSDFTEYEFPASWMDLKAHPDSAEGIKMIQDLGIKCVALSNGSRELIRHLAKQNGFEFDHVVSLAAHKVYKPRRDAYFTVQKDLGIDTDKTLMVTANPTFGDIEGALSVGMPAIVIRNSSMIQTIVDLAKGIAQIKQTMQAQ